MKRVSLEELTFAKFSDLLNASFRVHVDRSEVVQFKLVTATPQHAAARPRAAGTDGGWPESFSLVFTGPADRLLPQRIYPFEQAQIGSFDLFIVPIGKDAEGFRYEAVFNRVSRPGSGRPCKHDP